MASNRVWTVHIAAFVLLAAWSSTAALAGAARLAVHADEAAEALDARSGRALLNAVGYAATADGVGLLKVISSLQNSDLLKIGLHGGSLAAAVTHHLGVYLLRPPESNVSSLVANQTRWLTTGAARAIGWQALTGASAPAVAQQWANAGGIALVVVPAGCPSAAGGQVALVAPNGQATSSSVAQGGPSVALAGRTGSAKSLFGRCFTNKLLRYYRFMRPANTRPLPYFTRVWLNWMFSDAQYLFDVAPGGRADTVVIYYTGTSKPCFTRYLHISLGFDMTGWTHTAWYRPVWGSAGAKPYHFEYDMPQINFTVFNANQSLIYYKYKHALSVMAPQPGSGGCGSCGYWYSDNPQQAFAFYVSSRTSTTLKGKLLTVYGSQLVASEVLTDQEHPSNLKIFYQPGDGVPYEYSGTSDYTQTYTGELTWVPKWGSFTSAEGMAVVTFKGSRLQLQYYDQSVSFTKASQFRTGLPKLQ